MIPCMITPTNDILHKTILDLSQAFHPIIQTILCKKKKEDKQTKEYCYSFFFPKSCIFISNINRRHISR